MKTPEEIWRQGAMKTQDEGWLARNLDMDASVVIDVEAKKPTKRPGATALEVAKLCTNIGVLALFTWFGTVLGRIGKDPDVLIWVVLGEFTLALGFGLYAWGARSAIRRAAKGEEDER